MILDDDLCEGDLVKVLSRSCREGEYKILFSPLKGHKLIAIAKKNKKEWFFVDRKLIEKIC